MWVANRSALAHNAACLSASESRMWSSLGSLLRNKQLKNAFFSWSLGQRRSISARRSKGLWVARGGRLKSCSTRWMSVSWYAANRRRRSFVYGFAGSGSASTGQKTISRYCPFKVVITPLMQAVVGWLGRSAMQLSRAGSWVPLTGSKQWEWRGRWSMFSGLSDWGDRSDFFCFF